MTVRHTKFMKDLHEPVKVPAEIISAVCRVLEDANQYLRTHLT